MRIQMQEMSSSHTLLMIVTICLWSYMIPLHSQDPLLVKEGEFILQSVWQEYMPDAYVLDDSTLLTVGLTTNMSTLTMNIFLRQISIDGDVLLEKEIFNINNSNGSSYLLSSFYSGSAVDNEFLYCLVHTSADSCIIQNEMKTAYRLVKARKSDCEIVKDTILCFEGIRTFSDISTSQLEDSLYLYGALGYLNQNPDIILTTIPKDFGAVVEQMLRTTDTSILPLGLTGDSRAVAGSHYRHAEFEHQDEQTIWVGRINGDTILQKLSLEYFASNILWRSYVLDQNEIALLGYSLSSSFGFESSFFILRDDTISWNFYDEFFQELSDIIKIGDKYCIVQSSYRHLNRKLDKIVLHYIDEEGFPFGSDEFIAPSIQYTMSGIRIGDYYFVFVLIVDYDMLDAVITGEIPLEEAHWDYTHVFKFRINE